MGNRNFIVFNQICLLNETANQIIGFGMNHGNQTLSDYVDLNCGAVPQGEYAQVIDPAAPEQFLSLYIQIVENRFAVAVTEVLKMNKDYGEPILEYLNRVGESMGIKSIDNIKEAFEIVQSFVLDGMPGKETREVLINQDDKIEWKKIEDTHQKAWEKAGGDLGFYYKLQEAFVNGLLCHCGVIYSIKNGEVFTLSKQ